MPAGSVNSAHSPPSVSRRDREVHGRPVPHDSAGDPHRGGPAGRRRHDLHPVLQAESAGGHDPVAGAGDLRSPRCGLPARPRDRRRAGARPSRRPRRRPRCCRPRARARNPARPGRRGRTPSRDARRRRRAGMQPAAAVGHPDHRLARVGEGVHPRRERREPPAHRGGVAVLRHLDRQAVAEAREVLSRHRDGQIERVGRHDLRQRPAGVHPLAALHQHVLHPSRDGAGHARPREQVSRGGRGGAAACRAFAAASSACRAEVIPSAQELLLAGCLAIGLGGGGRLLARRRPQARARRARPPGPRAPPGRRSGREPTAPRPAAGAVSSAAPPGRASSRPVRASDSTSESRDDRADSDGHARRRGRAFGIATSAPPPQAVRSARVPGEKPAPHSA